MVKKVTKRKKTAAKKPVAKKATKAKACKKSASYYVVDAKGRKTNMKLTLTK